MDELNAGRFDVCINQGINVRTLNNETAAAMASLRYRDGQMRQPRVYTALDNPRDAGRFLAGVSGAP